MKEASLAAAALRAAAVRGEDYYALYYHKHDTSLLFGESYLDDEALRAGKSKWNSLHYHRTLLIYIPQMEDWLGPGAGKAEKYIKTHIDTVRSIDRG